MTRIVDPRILAARESTRKSVSRSAVRKSPRTLSTHQSIHESLRVRSLTGPTHVYQETLRMNKTAVRLTCIHVWLSATLAFASQPNVVVFLADDQGSGDLSATGNTNLATPNIDSLAHDGATLEPFRPASVRQIEGTRLEVTLLREGLQTTLPGNAASEERKRNSQARSARYEGPTGRRRAFTRFGAQINLIRWYRARHT